MITGSGRANKKEVQIHVRKILGKKIKSEKGKKLILTMRPMP